MDSNICVFASSAVFRVSPLTTGYWIITSWSTFCHSHCLQSALAPQLTAAPTFEPPDLSLVPPVYHDLGEVFSKQRAQTLPPHRPYDCAIDLHPGAPLPSSRLYNLTRPEREAMEKYINDSLVAGFIRPSSSPVGAGFFFVAKKDHPLRPCIDFRGLNDITVKNKYPLPLIDPSFEPLHKATVFSKLDLRNAYHLIINCIFMFRPPEIFITFQCPKTAPTIHPIKTAI